MATWDDVRRLVAALPGTDEHASYGGRPSWRVAGRGFVFERPLGAADLAALAELGTPVDGPVLGARTADEGEKLELLAADPDIYFTIPHFDGYPAVLIRLDRIDADELAELVDAAWRTRAPKKLLAERPPP